jgi:hypothetical protein
LSFFLLHLGMEKNEVLNKVKRFVQSKKKLASEVGADEATISRVLSGKQDPGRILLTSLNAWAEKQKL